MRHQPNNPGQYFPVIPIGRPSGEIENRGARRKFWVTLGDDGSEWLLKFPRPDTGEHWAEKVAAEIGRLLNIQTAVVELARVGDELATICLSFLTDKGASHYYRVPYPGRLHGSEFLGMTVLDYDPRVVWSNRAHNVKTIINAIVEAGSTSKIPNWEKLLGDLASFALLDALIGNTDRHHDNWTLLYSLSDGNLRMRAAPSYDHASSLGRELTDKRRERFLSSKGGVLSYLKKGRGGVFLTANRRAPSPLRLAQLLCRWNRALASNWCRRLHSVSDADFRAVINRVPPEFMTESAREFAFQVVTTSKAELLWSIR